jgi:hypothetical protein
VQHVGQDMVAPWRRAVGSPVEARSGRAGIPTGVNRGCVALRPKVWVVSYLPRQGERVRSMYLVHGWVMIAFT